MGNVNVNLCNMCFGTLEKGEDFGARLGNEDQDTPDDSKESSLQEVRIPAGGVTGKNQRRRLFAQLFSIHYLFTYFGVFAASCGFSLVAALGAILLGSLGCKPHRLQ